MALAQVCWSAVAKIVLEAMKGSLLPVGKEEISWTSALQTIDLSAKKLGYQIPFMGKSAALPMCNRPNEELTTFKRQRSHCK